MPTYDYICSTCNHRFEVSHKISEPSWTKCPECKNETLKRGIGGGSATFRFLGEGFYITDYKKECSAKESSSCCPCKNSQES